MSKRKKQHSRDTPIKSSPTVAVTTFDLWRSCLGEGYIPIYECPEVRMCIHAYADLISNMTIHLMENTDRGDIRIRNALSRKLDVNPYKFTNRKAWVYNIVNVMMSTGDGNCVVYPKYSRSGILEDLIPLAPSMIEIVGKPDDGYEVRYGNKTFQPDEVLHFTINPDPEKPWKGRGWTVSLREIVSSIRESGQTKKALIRSPAPSLIVKVDGLSEDFASKEGREKLKNQYVDSSNGEPWIIPAELMEVTTVKPMTMSDLAIKENLELDKRTMAGLFNMPPFVVGVGNYNEDEWQKFVNTAIMGVAQYIAQELTAKLIYKESWYWKFNPRSLYNYKLADLITAGSEMVDRMAMTRNEWRDWVGLSPREDMEELLALENYIPADRLGDQKKLNGGAADGNANA